MSRTFAMGILSAIAIGVISGMYTMAMDFKQVQVKVENNKEKVKSIKTDLRELRDGQKRILEILIENR